MHFKGTYFLLLASFLFAFSCKNACRNLDCQNEAICSDGECICQKWYAGDECELKYNRNYTGTYYGIYDVSNGNQFRSSDSLTLTAGEMPNELHVQQGFHLLFETDSTLIIPEQVVETPIGTYHYSGTGVYRADYLQIHYEVLDTENGHIEKVSFEGERVLKES
ncbi:MAG: hypothetical protein RLP15_08145 [Cryomorphaceae bacterium]